MNNINFSAVEQTAKAIQADPSLKMRSWHADIEWQDGVKNEVKIRDFAKFQMDEPQPLGGTDTAPNPVEMLIAAAGSCFAITFQVMASQNGVKLEAMNVAIDADLNAAVFLGLEEGEGGVLNPSITVEVKSDASKETLEKIAGMAKSKSPVLESLRASVKVNIVG